MEPWSFPRTEITPVLSARFPPEFSLHRVARGESLTRIIRDRYPPMGTEKERALIKVILGDNPDIKNPHLIYPDQILVLRIPRSALDLRVPKLESLPPLDLRTRAEIRQAKHQWRRATPQERNTMGLWADYGIGDGLLDMMSGSQIYMKQNLGVIKGQAEDLVADYLKFKRGEITQSAYRRLRKGHVGRIQTQLDPLSKRLVSKGKDAGKHFRVSSWEGRRIGQEILRTKNHTTQPMSKQLDKLSKMAKLASRGGGLVLAGATMGYSCYQMAQETSMQEKNKIFFQDVASTGLGAGAVAGVGTLVLLAGITLTPMVIVALATTGVVAGFLGHGAGTVLHNRMGEQFPVVEWLGITKICK